MQTSYDQTLFCWMFDYLQFIDFTMKESRCSMSKMQGPTLPVSRGLWVSGLGRPCRKIPFIGDSHGFSGIFSKLSQYNYDGWAVLECAIKHPEQGAIEGAPLLLTILSGLQKKPLMTLPNWGR